MFKARKKNLKRKENLRKKLLGDDNDALVNHDNDDDDNDDDGNKKDERNANEEENDDDSNTAAAIARIKKKRKLLTELQYKRGTNAISLLTKVDDGNKIRGDDDDTTAAAGGGGAGGGGNATNASSSQEGIMEQKHKQALEEYVESKLSTLVGGDDTKKKEATINDIAQKSGGTFTKEELYKQLAQMSEMMAGRTSAGDQNDPKNKNKNNNTNNNNTADGDVGTGGAMLVAGTGLAEVILPIHERLKSVQATQEAASAGPVRNRDYFGMPATASAAVLPQGTARFQVTAADKHRHFASNPTTGSRGGGQHQQQQHQQETSNTATTTTEDSPEDQGRQGFDALRGKVPTGSTDTGTNRNNNAGGAKAHNNHSGPNKHTRASDDKVYGKFIKHQRENQRRGR